VRRVDPAGFRLASLAQIGRDWLEYRDLLLTLTIHRIRVRYQHSKLGMLWALLQPLAMMLVCTLVFSRMAKLPSDGKPYAAFVCTALIPWTFFAMSLQLGCPALSSNRQLVTKLFFPREILPITYLLACGFDFLVSLLVLIPIYWYFGLGLTWATLYSVPVMAIGVLFTSAMVLLLSALQVRIRDLQHGLPVLLQIWMFATPVVYPQSLLPDWLRGWAWLNPMAGVVDGFRSAWLEQKAPDWNLLVPTGIFSLIFFMAAFAWFKREEDLLADRI
jgi:lipopolysaccharide transport system permease protein